MFRPFEVFVGLRYTRAKRRNHFISFISLSSMLGIALGITALITVLSVMNGFQKELRASILSMTAHATIASWDGNLSNWQQLLTLAKNDPQVVAGAPYVQAEAMLTNASRVSGAILQGIMPDQEEQVSTISEKMIIGQLSDLQAGAFDMILGQELARTLGVWVGDKVTVITPQANVTPLATVPVLKRFTVVGIFSAGMYQYDRTLALLNVEDAARLFRLDDAVSGIRLKFQDMFMAQQIAQELERKLPSAYYVRDWTREHANFFRAVQVEKTAMFVILTLIVAVAAFNIVSTLVMVVTDKQADIAILRTLGATPLSVMMIFIIQGITIGLIGTVLGLIGGISLALNIESVVPFIERVFGIQIMPADVYQITGLPSQIIPNDVVTVALVAFSLTVLATLYPAWRAARTHPAEALRYE
jgi:lipoprotein-releasing system permease protein